jgi:uncharacterized protein (UPF0332 family)
MIPEEYKESLKALEKAADAIENARYNLKGDFYGVTANRTYYACYYCLIALLYSSDTWRGRFFEEVVRPASTYK